MSEGFFIGVFKSFFEAILNNIGHINHAIIYFFCEKNAQKQHDKYAYKVHKCAQFMLSMRVKTHDYI